jgi:outer membrane lipoprotein-sorting protein
MRDLTRNVAMLLGVIVLLAADSRAQSPPQTADEIVARHLQAKGGAERLRAVKSVRTSGRLQSAQGPEVKLASWVKRPNMLRRDVIPPDGQTLTLATDGTTVWIVNPVMGGTPQEVRGVQADMTKQEASEFDGVLLDYKDRGSTVELVGTESAGDVALTHLKLTTKSGTVQHIYINPTTNLEVKKVMTVEQGGMKREVTTEFSDYRDVDGIMVPFMIRQSVGGQMLVQLIVDTMEFNAAVEDGLFKLPKK